MIKSLQTILIVDDDQKTLDVVARMLQTKNYRTIACDNVHAALAALQREKVEVVLTDYLMPGMSGLDLLGELKAKSLTIPVILMTGQADVDMAIDAVKLGIFAIVTKPMTVSVLYSAIDRALRTVRKETSEKEYRHRLEETIKSQNRELSGALRLVKCMSGELIRRLTAIAEFRDTDTGQHISRIGLYCNKLAETMDLPQNFVEAITFASSMHDIGKVAISDQILLKRGPLTPEEFEDMKKHTEIGKRLLEGSEYPLIQMAASVAYNHHEQYDGGGYPRGLSGESIPLEGRIVAIADQYDALRSNRTYKQGMSHRDAHSILTTGGGKTKPEHFDPAVLDAFDSIAPLFEEIYDTHMDENGFGSIRGGGDGGASHGSNDHTLLRRHNSIRDDTNVRAE